MAAEYRQLVTGRKVREDVAFRRVGALVPAEGILKAVADAAKIDAADLRTRRRDSRWRAVASWTLSRYAGLTQREVAMRLGLGTGAAVSRQLRELNRLLEVDAGLRQAVRRVERQLRQAARKP